MAGKVKFSGIVISKIVILTISKKAYYDYKWMGLYCVPTAR